MIKALGFNQGQIGDLAMQVVLCKRFKNIFPDSHITFGINKKYESCKDIFKENKYIDDIKIWDGYDDWPTKIDKKFLDDYSSEYDYIFNPMSCHIDQQWYTKTHHIQAFANNHGLGKIEDLKIDLERWFDLDKKYKNCIAITAFSSATGIRDIPKDFCNKIIDYIHSLGYETIQLGLKNHEKLNTTYEPIGGSVIEDVIIAASCKMVLTTDTGMNWIMSGYKQNVLGLYSSKSYPIHAPLYNRTPINPNALYLESDYVGNISLETIFNYINLLTK
jgi:ADP-heptose:LPS heptosyltransferase